MGRAPMTALRPRQGRMSSDGKTESERNVSRLCAYLSASCSYMAAISCGDEQVPLLYRLLQLREIRKHEWDGLLTGHGGLARSIRC